jgi:hypothetical protein
MASALRFHIVPGLVISASLVVFTVVGARPVMGQTPPTGGTVTTRGTPHAPGPGMVAPQPVQPAPEFGFEESLLLQEAGIREQESFPERIRGVYAPSFLRSFSTTVRTSETSGLRMGMSGWTATRIPYDDRNANGGPALGLTIEWGKPLPPPAEPATPTEPPQR